MTPIVVRAVFLAMFIAAAFLVARVAERRGSTPSATTGTLTLITSRHCRLCPLAITALRTHGAVFATVDIDDPHPFPRFRSLPAAVVTDRHGTIIMKRTGRSVIDDAAAIAKACTHDPGSSREVEAQLEA